MNANCVSRIDWLSAVVLWVATFAVFGASAGRLGFYADDSSSLSSLPFIHTARGLWGAMKEYVPGRNLHLFWDFLLYRMVGDPLVRLPALHLAQSAIDALVVVVFFLLLRLLRLPGYAAAVAAALFAFWPVHGETHFWLESVPMNLLSTLFVLLFAVTSVALARGRRGSWLWALDAAAFFCALFTYDQVFFVLLLLVGVRAAAVREWRFAVLHLPHLAASAFWLWLRLTAGSDLVPAWHNILSVLVVNLRHTARTTVGGEAWRLLASLWARVTQPDWLLVLLVVAVLVGLWGWLLLPAHSSRAQPFPWRMLSVALLFSIAAYLPVWLWFVSARHHYLPSLGLFTVVALCLAWVFERIRGRTTRLLLVQVLGAATLFLAAATRGESRLWEDAFAAKRQLFAELKPDLQGKEVLVLEDFPVYLGPAPLIYPPHDGRFAPLLLHHGSLSLGDKFVASASSAPAPGGIFIETQSSDNPTGFRYCPTDNFLMARFTSWENGRLAYELNPRRSPPYQILSAAVTSQEGRFAVHRFSARREGDGMTVSLRFQAHLRPHSYLSALFSFLHGGTFYRWTRAGSGGRFSLLPVLLSDPGAHHHSGSHEWSQILRLDSIPGTERVAVEFYQASCHDDPILLGRSEAAVEP